MSGSPTPGKLVPRGPRTHRLVRCRCGATTSIRAHLVGVFNCTGCGKTQRLVR